MAEFQEEKDTTYLTDKILARENGSFERDVQKFLKENEAELTHPDAREFFKNIVKSKPKELQKTMESCAISLNMDRGNLSNGLAGKKPLTREAVMALAVVASFTVDEANRLLKYMGMQELYARNKVDAIVMTALVYRKDLDSVQEAMQINGLGQLV